VNGAVAERRVGLLVNDFRTSSYVTSDLLRAGHNAVLVEPLLYRDTLLGVIVLDHGLSDRQFTSQDQETLRLFASQAAIAIENARLHQAAVRRSAEREALLAATRSVMSGLDLQEILDRIVVEACRISGASHVKVVLVDREANALRVGAARGSGQVPGELMPLDRGASGIVARTGQPLFSPHHLSDPDNLYVDQDTKLGLVTYLGLPITRGAKVLGVLTFNTTTPKEYSSAEVAYLSAFADQAASAIENARLFAAAGEHRDRLLALIRAIGPMTAGLDLEATLGQIVSAAATIARCDHVRLLLVDAATQTLRIPVTHGLAEPAGPLPTGTGLSGLVATTGQALYVADTPTDPRNLFPDLDRQVGLHTYLGLPIALRGHVLGVLTFRTTEPRTYPPEEIEYFGLFAAQAAIAIENARLYDAAQHELAERTRAEEALQRYHLLADEARDLVLFVRQDGRILDANRAAVAAYGYAREHLLTLTLHDLRALETQPLTAAQLAQATAEGILFETVHRHRDGSTFPVEVSSRGTTMGGELVLLSIIRDITARKQAEAALARRTRHLEALRAVSEEITHELDLTRLLRLLIARAAELVGASAATLYLWEPAHGLLVPAAWHGLGDWQATLRQPLGQGIAGTVAQTRQGLCVNDYRTSRYAHPVTLQHTQLTASLGEPLLYREELIGAITVSHEAGRRFTGEDQELVRLFATQAAIAVENARLYQAAVRRGAELEALLRTSRSLMSGLDVQKILDRIALEAAAIAGTPSVKVLLVDTDAGQLRLGALTGATACDFPIPVGTGLSGLVASTGEPLFSPDCQQDPRNASATADRAAGIVTYLGLPIRSRGAVVGVLTFSSTAPRAYPPEELAYLLSFADQAAIAIENARLFAELNESYARLQAAQTELVHSEKLRGLGQMAAGIAHDLNNTLAAILGQVELMKLRGVPPDIQEHLSTLETAASDGAHVVRRLQDFSRQRASVPLVSLALRPVVQEALDLTAPRWKDEVQRRGHTIHVHVALDDLPPILGHAPEIREALTNLIFNAVDAMPAGGVLTVTGTTSPAEVCLHVGDTGVGMPETVRQKVFEPFFTTKGVTGTGLGLSVVYGIMERHGGRVDVTSVSGQGTTFTLGFQPAPAEPIGTAPDSPPARTLSRRILVIDDDPTVRCTMTELLRAAGQTVLVAESGPAGLAHLAHTLPDLVLTDLGMPEMSGVDVARRVKAAHPRLPVVLLTGWGDTATLPPEDRQVVDRVLGKPVRLAELLRVVAELTESADSATTRGMRKKSESGNPQGRERETQA
jgi:PAS domain S-box-containing protein